MGAALDMWAELLNVIDADLEEAAPDTERTPDTLRTPESGPWSGDRVIDVEIVLTPRRAAL